MLRAEQADIDAVRFPDLTDLMARLRFSTSDGCIWLDEQRMLLVHAKAMGSLRGAALAGAAGLASPGRLTPPMLRASASGASGFAVTGSLRRLAKAAEIAAAGAGGRSSSTAQTSPPPVS